MKKVLSVFLAIIVAISADAQTVSINDVVNFFDMWDSVKLVVRKPEKLNLIKRLYIDKATEGLTVFMRNKTGLDEKWLTLLESHQGFWDSLQTRLPIIRSAASSFENQIKQLAVFYDSLVPAKTFFIVGTRQQGGTIRGNLSLIGTEVVLANSVSDEKTLIRMALHEYIHTQQVRPDFQKIDVLTSAIREGSCDFIASLVSGIPTNEVYMKYGQEHEKKVWKKFLEEMNTTQNDNWVSTGDNPLLMARDLGYFVGYRICETYYRRSTDKKLAIKEIMKLDYSNQQAVNTFFEASGYQGRPNDPYVH